MFHVKQQSGEDVVSRETASFIWTVGGPGGQLLDELEPNGRAWAMIGGRVRSDGSNAARAAFSRLGLPGVRAPPPPLTASFSRTGHEDSSHGDKTTEFPQQIHRTTITLSTPVSGLPCCAYGQGPDGMAPQLAMGRMPRPGDLPSHS